MILISISEHQYLLMHYPSVRPHLNSPSKTCPLMQNRVRIILIIIFNLRGVYLTSQKEFGPDASRTSSSADFARDMFGNIGAPLTTSDEEDIDDENDYPEADQVDSSFVQDTECHDHILEIHLRDGNPDSPKKSIPKRKSTISELEKGYVYYDDCHQIVVVDIKYA